MDVIMEASPVNEHRSNGVDERAVQTNGGMVRTPKLEQSYSKEMEADHVVIPWLIMHRAEMVLDCLKMAATGRQLTRDPAANRTGKSYHFR